MENGETDNIRAVGGSLSLEVDDNSVAASTIGEGLWVKLLNTAGAIPTAIPGFASDSTTASSCLPTLWWVVVPLLLFD